MNPQVSIYIPTKNRLSMLRRAVYSVLGQTCRDIELIVVTDGCDDRSDDFVSSISSDIPVRLISNSQALGACRARNQAIEAASGKFVTGLDDDDWLRPDRIALFIEKWRQAEVGGGRFSALFDATVAIRRHQVLTWNWASQVDLQQISKVNAVGSQVFTLRQRYLECGSFDPAMPAWQDWDLWFRLIEQFGPAINLQQATYFSDQAHTEPRITTGHYENIRAACALFAKKHQLSQARDMSPLLMAYARYPQARLSMGDMLMLLRGKEFGGAFRCLRRGQVEWPRHGRHE